MLAIREKELGRFSPGDLVVVIFDCYSGDERAIEFRSGDIGMYLEDSEPNKSGSPCGNILIKGVVQRFCCERLKRYKDRDRT